MGVATLERAASRSRPKSFLEREFWNGRDAKFLIITPEIARELLANNPNNRKVSPTKVRQYAADMANGRWQVNGETIIIANDGRLNTGQKRLLACIEADTPFETLVVYGVERDTRDTVDTGQPQGAGDKLAMRGVPNANNLAAMAMMAIAYERSSGRNINTVTSYATKTEALEYVQARESELLDAFRFAHRAPKSFRGLASHTMIGLAAYLLREHGDVARAYLTQVMFGENISQSDPAYRVRERLSGMGRGNRQARLEAILRGWVSYRDGRPMSLIKIMGELPRL